jgi:hypothetical protein
MNITASTESKKIWINLANAIADALACAETPAMLVDPLAECVNGLSELLTLDRNPHRNRLPHIAVLRGLAADAAQKLEEQEQKRKGRRLRRHP